MNLLDSREKFMEAYRENKRLTWVLVKFKSKEFYFKDFDHWYEIQKLVGTLGPIQRVSIQYRSNVVHTDLKGCSGVYIVRSVLGKIGGDSIDTITIGKIMGESVEKTIWSIPDLSDRDTNTDTLENCFEKAVVRWL